MTPGTERTGGPPGIPSTSLISTAWPSRTRRGAPGWARGWGRGIPLRDIAQRIGDHLGLATESIPADRLQEHFGFLATVIVLDNPTSTHHPAASSAGSSTHPGLLADFDHGDYF